MAYFRKLTSQLTSLQALLKRDENWLILINADPDAMAGALAFTRLVREKVHSVTLARINDISRPDNLAMIRYLRIPVSRWEPMLERGFHRFALIDSQPHHSPAFADIPFSVIIDHHPLAPTPFPAPFTDIRPEYGATSTILTEYLYNARIRPGRRLAVALQYGIRTDTNTFGRNSSEVDMRAYHYLSRFSEPSLLLRILRSEYLPEWLPYFSRAFEHLRRCGKGHFTFLEEVESPDILVVVADFFLRVHGLRWVAVCGVHHEKNAENSANDKLVTVFRGDGDIDLGKVAVSAFGMFGSAGGHKSMARAEFMLSHLENICVPCTKAQAAQAAHVAQTAQSDPASPLPMAQPPLPCQNLSSPKAHTPPPCQSLGSPHAGSACAAPLQISNISKLEKFLFSCIKNGEAHWHHSRKKLGSECLTEE